ncbi:hypothetical protein BJX70DRAFT_91224 [Aspergillus crustosus]
MVYPGRPSTGCQTCRNRRIKCDETRPTCKACVRTGRECPGYPHPLDVMLRPQTGMVRKSRNTPAATPKRDDVDAEAQSSNSVLSRLPCYPETSSSIVSPQIPGGLYLPREDTVTALFFNSYVYTPRDPMVRMGSMEILPQLYAAASSNSHLHMSALSVAFFSVAAWTRQKNLLQEAHRFFGKALSRTRQALQGDVEQNFDEILMTLMLLYLYELFTSIKENKPSPKHHLRGAIALINSCDPGRRNSPLSDTLTNAFQKEIIISATTDDSTQLFKIPEVWPLSPPIPQVASSRLTMISTYLVKLRERWMQFSAQVEPLDLHEAGAILSEARQLDDQFSAWTLSLPKHWDPNPASFIPQSVKDAGLYQGRCDCYTDSWIAETWNEYRTYKLSVLKIIFRCLCLLSSSVDEIQSTTATIYALAADICATVPFFLGSQTGSMQITDSRVEYPLADWGRGGSVSRQQAPLVGGWFIIYPLKSLCSAETLPEEIVTWAQGQVQRVHQIYTSGLKAPGV